MQVLTFKIDSLTFALDIRDIKEINENCKYTPVYHAPEEVLGYTNIRGQIYLILDLNKTLESELHSEDNYENKKIIIFKDSISEPFGIVVDEIGDVINVLDNQIDYFSTAMQEKRVEFDNSIDPNLIQGIIKEQNELLILLNSKKVLSVLEN